MTGLDEEGILARLIEKKNAEIYIKVRIRQLDKAAKKVPQNTESEKREQAINRLKGRKREIKKLRQVLNEDSLKEYAKRNWEVMENEVESE